MLFITAIPSVKTMIESENPDCAVENGSAERLNNVHKVKESRGYEGIHTQVAQLLNFWHSIISNLRENLRRQIKKNVSIVYIKELTAYVFF